MLMSVLESSEEVDQYPELAGKRILITGLSPHHGIDIARAFADHGCRLVLHMSESSETANAVLEVLAQSAAEMRAYCEPLDGMEAAVRFAQTAAQAFGGLEAVINLVEVSTSALFEAPSASAVENAVAEQLQTAFLITRVAANRMRVTWSDGLIVNAVRSPAKTRAEAALAGLTRAMLATLTRLEAEQWANQGIRINGVAPCVPDHGGGAGSAACRAPSEPDVAALALHLASARGKTLSGLVFDPTGAAVCC
jgi:NAD(P)-dependent dehydrogenase (short-subunit alcohol dehydrogenase family)